MPENIDILEILGYIERDDRKEFIDRINKVDLTEYEGIIVDYLNKNNRDSLKKIYFVYKTNQVKYKDLSRCLETIHTNNHTNKSFLKMFSSETKIPSECSICLEDFRFHNRITLTKCNHYFHKYCLESWMSKNLNNFRCPLCQKVMIK